MPKVIVSYRRSDSRWITGRIVDRLERDLGKGNVFVDIDAIPFGMDFRDHLRSVLGRCDVLLAIIGPDWLAVHESGQPRIFEATDWVRVEIETALACGTAVIPVLIDRAPMPKASELPESMHAFAFRQAADVDTGRDFHIHMDRLVRAISQATATPRPILSPAAAAEPQDETSGTPSARSHQTRRHWGMISAVVAAAVVAAVAVLLTHQWSDRPAIVASGSGETPPRSNVQGPQASLDTPLLPTAPSDQPAPLEPRSPLDAPLLLDLPASPATPVVKEAALPSDRPIPPAPIEQPQQQRAMLVEAERADSNGPHFDGSVTWRAVKMSSGFFGQRPDLAAIADIIVPDRKLALTLSLRVNDDPNLPASHTIEVSFKLPSDFAPGGVSNVPSVRMKDVNESRGMALAGLSVQVRPGAFLIGLSAAGSDRARNLQLLRERAWFEIPIVYSNGTRAILTLEKGTDGDRVFKQVFAAWRE
jgi:hypothetical protein